MLGEQPFLEYEVCRTSVLDGWFLLHLPSRQANALLLDSLLMKKLLVLILASSSLSFADTKEEITQIRQHYNKIESAKGLKVTEIRTDEDFAPNLGSIKRYTNSAGIVVKQTTEWGGDHGGVSRTAYFLNGEIFFIFSSMSSWQFDPSSDPENPSTIETLREERHYYVDGKCIRALEKEGSSPDYEDALTQLKAQANKEVEDPQDASAHLKEAYAMLKISSRKELEAHMSL
ncbi:hypothetical protein [Rubritalea sp.]|uniref:hypothetical protein n=1 Tax=Rubritalea sp. TaxID=2109375 RepID=UPI003EF68F8D